MKRKHILLTILAVPVLTIFASIMTHAAGGWDNDNFIDATFWSNNPTSGDIINALYGGGAGNSDKTAYTQYRGTSTCNTGSMSIVYLSGGGLNTIPSTLTANTIYLLSGGTYYTVSATRNMSNCSALIGKGDVTIQATNSVGQRYVINSTNAKNRILDGIKIDRNYTGAIGANGAITIQGVNSTSITINNIQTYNATSSQGIYNSSASYLRINNSQMYNNTVGVYNAGIYCIITNSQFFDQGNANVDRIATSGIIDNCQSYNSFVGFRFNVGSNGNTLNNSQVYNNSYGIQFASSNNNIINNIQIYNNNSYGISFTTGDNNIINNIWTYNNANPGIYIANAATTNTKYYGNNKSFYNLNGNIGGITANLITGSSNDFPGLGRSDGVMDQSTSISRDYITVPKNASGTYMQIRSGAFTSARANKITTFTAKLPIQYSYGSGILTQLQAVAYYTGSSITNRATPTTTNYIGSNATKTTGDLIGIIDGINTPTNITVTGTTSSLTTKYNVFGEITSSIFGVDINTSTGIQIFSNNGSGFARIIGDIYDPSTNYSTHFEKHPIREEPNNNVFVDVSFWASNPSTGDIIKRFYGGGAGSTDKSAYTQNRTTNTCTYANMSMTTLSPGTDTIPTTLNANTLYILNAGIYLTTATRNMGTCSALIGKGSVEIRGSFATNTRLVSSASKQNRIIDNVKTNRNYTGASSAEAIYCSASSSVTINNSELYNAYHGFNSASCHYAQIANSKFYNNQMYGLSIGGSNSGTISNVEAYRNGYGIVVTSSYGNTINDSKAYNNVNHGIYLNVSLYTTISNAKCFNNSSDGVYFFAGSNYNTINNSQLYNNGLRGLDNFSNSNYNTINNSQSYNNVQAGVYFASSYSGIINNTQSYNNGQAGFYFAGPGAGYFRVNNSQSYNNASDGIKFISATTGAINNTWIYNNDGYGVNVDSSSPANKYYGTIQIFGNTSIGIGGTVGNFTAGLGFDYPGLGRTAGNIDTSNNISRNYFSNPLNSSGLYLLNRSGQFTSLRGKSSYTGTTDMRYSYGSGILLQGQPIAFSGTSLTNSGTFTGANYIGGNATKYTGILQGIGLYNNIMSTFTGIASSPISLYNLFGDLQSFVYGVPINTNTGTTFLGGITTGKIITQIYESGSYFATHFQDITTIDRVGPPAPTLVSPNNGQGFTTGSVSLERSVSTDTGVGTSGYIYQVSTDIGFTTFVISGTQTTTGVSLINFTDGTYYRRVYAYDIGGTTGARSSTGNFTISTILAPVIAFTGSTPADNAWITTNSFSAQLNIVEANLNQFTRGRNGVNYNIYDSGLVALYNFDKVAALGETTALARDSSLQNKTGTVSYATRTGNGKRNGAFIFDGSNSVVTSDTRALGTSATFSTRAKYTNTNTKFLRNYPVDTYGAGYFDLYFIGNNIYQNAADGQGNPYTSGGVNITWPSINQWHLYTTVLHAGNNKSYLYIDGTLAGSAAYRNPLSTAIRSFEIGGKAGYRWDGMIDEFRIYNRALTANEVQILYNSNINKYDSNNWNFIITTTGIVSNTYQYTGTVSNNGGLAAASGRTITIGTFSLISPINNIWLTTGNINLERESSFQASGYLYQISTDGNFTNIINSGTSVITGASVINLMDGVYYVKVYAINNIGTIIGESNVNMFNVDIGIPTITFTGSTPADNAWITNNSFTAQLDIIESNLTQFRRSRSGVDYNIYDSGLVALYNFDKAAALGESNSIARDFSLQNKTGTVSYATRTGNGKRNGAFIFNGSNTVITSDTRALGTSATFSTRATYTNGDLKFLRNHPSDTYGAGYFDLYFIGNNIYQNAGDGQSNPYTSGGVNITRPSINQRHLYTTVLNASDNKSYLYIDGTLAGTAGYRNPLSTAIRTFEIAGIGGRWDGMIDEFRIYNRALTASEVQILYNSNINKYDSNKWNFTVNRTGITEGLYRYTGYASDIIGNIYQTGRNIGIDFTLPSTPTLLAPDNGSGINTSGVNLLRSLATDNIAVSGYRYQVSTDSGFATFVISGTHNTTGASLINFTDGTYYRRVLAFDLAGNAGSRSTARSFIINTNPISVPIVGTGYISVGTTGTNGGNNYYKGIVNLKASMTGTNIISCQYTIDGNTRLTASTGSNYCEAINLSLATDIHVQFRATNSAGTTTGGITNYIYDNTAPVDVLLASPADGTLVNTVSLQLTWNTAADTGIGTQGYHYIIALDSGFTTIIQQASTTSTNISLVGLADNTYYRKVYAYDNLGNIGNYSTTFSVDYSYTFAATLVFVGINTPSLADKFSEAHFIAPGNNFGGSIFWLASKSISGGVDIIDAGLNTKNCTKLVRGLYYNSQRGKRLWPLDQYSLQLLKNSNSNYSELSITGGWYTSCTNDPYSIYGKISYSRSGGRDSDLIAGTKLIYQTNKADPYFAQSLQYFDNKTPIGFIRDSLGGIGFIGGELTDYNGLITDINNGGSIVSGFTYSGTTIVSSTGGIDFIAATGINNASNTLWNLIVQGTIGLSQSLNNQEKIGIMGNPQTKTVIYNSNDISNAGIINEAAQSAEKLCKGKTWLTTNNRPNNYADDIICFNNTNLSIDLVNNASDFSNKTIIVRNGSVIMSNTMSNASPSLDLFIDQGNLYLNNTLSDMQNFDVQGYPDDSAVTNSGLFIRGNIIINGLIIGGSPGSETGFAHKLHLQGKLSSFNAPLAPTTGRITLIENLIGAQYISYINLQNIFVRECGLLGIASDGSSCGSIGDISRTPLVIVDGKYSSRLLGN